MDDKKLERGQLLKKGIAEATEKLAQIRRGLDHIDEKGVNHNASVNISYGYNNESWVKLFSKSDLSYQPGYFPLDLRTMFVLAEVHTASILAQMEKEYEQL